MCRGPCAAAPGAIGVRAWAGGGAAGIGAVLVGGGRCASGPPPGGGAVCPPPGAGVALGIGGVPGGGPPRPGVVAEAAVNLLPRPQAAARRVLMAAAAHLWERAAAVIPQPVAVRGAALRPREAEEVAALARLFAVAA